MSDVFISYSRKDSAFTKRLYDGFAQLGRDIWVDWEDIPLSANWWREIQEGIEGADSFIFVMSPASLTSPICNFEVAHALQAGKRIIPVLLQLVDQNQVFQTLEKAQLDEGAKDILAGRDFMSVVHQSWSAIARHNWLAIQDDALFEANFQKLVQIIETDLDHAKAHTRYLIRARQWEDGGRKNGFLLTGFEAGSAIQWLEGVGEKSPAPTQLQQEFIRTSWIFQRNRNVALVAGVLVTIALAFLLVLSFIGFSTASKNLEQAIAAEATAVFSLQQADSRVLAGRLPDIAFDNRDLAVALAIDLLNFINLPDAARFAVLEFLQFDYARWTLDWSGGAIVNDLDFNSDGSQLAIAQGNSVQIVSSQTGQVLERFAEADATVETAALSNRGYLLGITQNQEIVQWAEGQREVTNNFAVAAANYDREADARIFAAPDGDFFVTTNGKDLFIWDANNGTLLETLSGHSSWVSAIAISPNAEFVLSAGTDGNVILWDIQTGNIIHSVPFPEAIQAAAVAPDGTRAVIVTCQNAACERSTLNVLDLTTGRINLSFAGRFSTISQVEYSPDSSLIFSASTDATITIWDTKTGERLKTLTGHSNPIAALAVSPNGRYLASGDINGAVIYWSIEPSLDEIFLSSAGLSELPELTCEEREAFRTVERCE